MRKIAVLFFYKQNSSKRLMFNLIVYLIIIYSYIYEIITGKTIMARKANIDEKKFIKPVGANRKSTLS